ncbi:MAG TPA: serine hydrolase domain-containing protein [Gemmatimonadales bacterium]|nr:serine hydrolase domain-containing protein [Gemmatimonadales bacterium]
MHYLDSVIQQGAAPGAVLGVSRDGERFIYGTGSLGQSDTTRPDATTIYDLASLTKVIGLATGIMLAVSDELMALDTPVQRYVTDFVGTGKERVTVRLLLSHASGLPGWRPFYKEAHTRQDIFALASNTPLETTPGSVALYSDVGAIILTRAIELVYGERIDSLLHRRVFTPLELLSLQYLPPAAWHHRIAPTELDPWRGRMLRGEVHDENAAAMEGVSGHAGLFGSVEDVLTFAESMIEKWKEGDPLVREFTRRQDLVLGSSRALGWDTPSLDGSAGKSLSTSSFGHTGFTGTSLWIDPQHRLAIVLLSNRVHPTRNNPRWAPVRAAVADLVMTTLAEEIR